MDRTAIGAPAQRPSTARGRTRTVRRRRHRARRHRVPGRRHHDRNHRNRNRSRAARERPRPRSTDMGVILINPFDVPAGREDEFIERWDAAAEYMRRQPGFRWTRLHQAVTPNPKFAFVNVAEMDSNEQFLAAITTDEFA